MMRGEGSGPESFLPTPETRPSLYISHISQSPDDDDDSRLPPREAIRSGQGCSCLWRAVPQRRRKPRAAQLGSMQKASGWTPRATTKGCPLKQWQERGEVATRKSLSRWLDSLEVLPA